MEQGGAGGAEGERNNARISKEGVPRARKDTVDTVGGGGGGATHFRVWMVSICSAMVASVPMPLVSMRAMRSDSESRGGAWVDESRSSSTLGTKLMPTAKSGSSLPSHFSHTRT